MKKITLGSEGRGSWGLYWVIKSIREKFKDCEIIIPPHSSQHSPDLITGKFDNITIKENSLNCDFIIKSNFIDEEKPWNTKSKKYIYWSGETHDPVRSDYETDYINIFTKKPIDEKTIHMPFFMYSPFLYKERIQNKKSKLLAYCSFNRVEIREDLFNLFIEKTPENSCVAYGERYGKYSNTNCRIGGCWFSECLLKNYSLCNFVFSMENKIWQGYVTEKIINAFVAGSISIFWGDSDYVKFIFNKNSFIDVSDFYNLEECADYVINMTKNQIKWIQNQPIFNTIEEIDSRDYIYKQFSKKINDFLFQ